MTESTVLQGVIEAWHAHHPATRQTPRQTLPQYRWPSERHLAPARCGHCGVALILTDVPTAAHPLADVSCWSCSRVACELIHDGARVLRVVR